MTAREKAMIITKITEWLERELHTDDAAPVTGVRNIEQPAELLTHKECTELVKGLSEHTVRQLAIQGIIPSLRTGTGRRQQDSHKQVSFASVRFRECSPKATNCITAYHRRALIYSSANLIISQHACACQGYSKFFRFIIGAKNFGTSPLSRLADCDVRRLSRRKHKSVLAAQERLPHSKRFMCLLHKTCHSLLVIREN